MIRQVGEQLRGKGFVCCSYAMRTPYEDLNAKTCSDCNSTKACTPKTDFVVCSCEAGFVGDGLNCTRLVFCDSSPCCPQGYQWDFSKKQCTDVNECLSETTNACLGKSYCINRNGFYMCNRSATPPACPTTSCSFDQDCVKSVSSSGEATLQCIDPCTSYTYLDGSKRLYNMTSTGRFYNDRYVTGWRRYTKGLRMKEGCVSSLKCGSLTPFSLTDHPYLNEGVKLIPLYTNGLQKCAQTVSIPVKACPGGYYVYKLSELLTYDVYCTGLDFWKGHIGPGLGRLQSNWAAGHERGIATYERKGRR
ncbi:uromodulin-like isoform X2 [Hyperolius riggenbachi]|uniref:uromodulin-like isoform X2 n=1 Tax=Hyperolius riggenbachi TaxID=752182 RepID=UPI0035A32665